MILTVDIETDSKFSKIWICYTHNSETNEFICHKEPTTLAPLLNEAELIVGHNLIGFDGPLLNRLWGMNISLKKSRDTLVMSRLWNPSIEDGHSLEAWGKRIGNHKVDYRKIWHWMSDLPYDKDSKEPFDSPIPSLLSYYCQQDVAVTVEVYNTLSKELQGWGESVELEHHVAAIIKKQEDNGFKFDDEKAQILLALLNGEVADIEGELQMVFPPIIEERVSEKTGKKLKDKVNVFNPASRQQIAERLIGLGVTFNKQTEKGNIIIDEKTLSEVDLPEAALISRYLLLNKRISQIKSWREAVKEDGRVHGKVITNGAVTGRMTHHSPNMAQVPNAGSEYGPECRDLWIVDEGYKLVGADASGLELRMLAHYMRDEEYVKTVVEGSSKNGTDVHTKNQKAAGLQTRDQAKTFIYAFLYGAGPAKIGSIVGGKSKEGMLLIQRFLKATPALQRLRDKVASHASKGFVPGLDGRKVWVRSEHAALNTLLQSAGAIVMKKALVLLHQRARRGIIDIRFSANVHDEFQLEVESEDAELVGKMAVESIIKAGEYFKLRCPLDGEFKIGNTWKETH